MIEIFEGRLGGGKTYNAVQRIALHLSKGGYVFTNIELLPEKVFEFVAEVYGVQPVEDQLQHLPNEKIPAFHHHVPWGALRGSGDDLRVLVVIDEAHLYFNARNWAKANEQLLAFLTQSDKVSVDIIFITQAAANVDKQFGRLIQYVWRFRDLSKWSIPGLGLRYPFQTLLVCQFDQDGSTLLRREFQRKDTRVFGCYKTAALLTEFPNTAGKVAKVELNKVDKGGSSKMWKFLLIVGVIGCFAMYKLFATLRDDFGAKSKEEPSASVTEAVKDTLIPRSGGSNVLFRVVAERFRGLQHEAGVATLRTELAHYRVGSMSPHGLVVGLDAAGQVAKCSGPDGLDVFVVAVDLSTPNTLAAPQTSPTPRQEVAQ